MLEVKDLFFQYPGASQPSVQGVSFAIRKGEIFGLLGPNGAGKSTTISMLSCLMPPGGGTVQIAGHDVVQHAHEVKQRIGLIPQELALYPALSAHDNLRYFGGIYGLRGRMLRQRVTEALAMVGLSNRTHDKVNTFSGGMKRRVNIAAGLLHRPEILFLDEPTVGVDPQSRNFIFDNVEALNREGMTIVYTTHYMEEVERLCQRIAIVDQGKLIALDTPRALIEALGGGVVMLNVPEGTPESLDATLRTCPGVLEVRRIDGRIALNTQAVSQALTGALAALEAAGVALNGLQVLEPNLETVFLELTGRSLRD
ncbi:hypothetical protein CJ255_01000 [Candidatus Viridilinea mediisalina]|uniref:ABC transporter domain-containing protein n=2 Tax=Candidatus Viridilinea mediisalina TaxID=2024553 RepID=A0A2A6RPR6_9CHLR|nr:hypothetical protein CJ255_01000 [Candidatus Viridilinea mediisalina]